MRYTPSPIPASLPASARDWLANELRRISAALEGVDSVQLATKGAEPDKYSDGDVVYADGTSWDPGDGEGVYNREGGAWVKSGGSFDLTADYVMTGKWTFNLPSLTDPLTISKNPSTTVPVLALQHNYSGGNGLLLECRKTPSTWVARIDNEGDAQMLGSIGVGNGFSLSYTVESQYMSFMQVGKNQGMAFFGTNATHFKRGRSTFGNRPSTPSKTQLANQDFDDVTIRRGWDGASVYTAAGALLLLNKDITNSAGDTSKYLEWSDDVAGQYGEIDENGNLVMLNDTSIYIAEKAAALASVAGRGQLWVKNTTPCELWFTDDAGTSTKIV